MEGFTMYFTSITPLNESWEFTIRNFTDLQTIPPDDVVKHTEEKLKRVEAAFNTYYKFDEETEDKLLEEIGKIIKKDECDPIDLPKIDRMHHLKLKMQLSLKEYTISRLDFVRFYTILYRELYVPNLPHYMTKYTLLKFIGGRFIIFITFDEKSISDIHIPVSDNQLDITSPVYLMPLYVNTKIFKKSKT